MTARESREEAAKRLLDEAVAKGAARGFGRLPTIRVTVDDAGDHEVKVGDGRPEVIRARPAP